MLGSEININKAFAILFTILFCSFLNYVLAVPFAFVLSSYSLIFITM